MNFIISTHYCIKQKEKSWIPLPSWIRSSHSFPPFNAGLKTYLTLNLVPEASGALQSDQSDMIHGSGTVMKE